MLLNSEGIPISLPGLSPPRTGEHHFPLSDGDTETPGPVIAAPHPALRPNTARAAAGARGQWRNG